MVKILGFFSVFLLLQSCGNNDFTPKPHAYPRVYFPEKKYQTFDSVAPYSFLYPVYANIQDYNKTENDFHSFWYNINYLPFNATLHLSYLPFTDRNEFNNLFDDTRKLVYKHDIKAEEIEETEIYNPKNQISGIIYELKGNTATNLNFYVSDSKKHFLRGALYFNSQTEIDSIQPVFDFLKEDIIKMIESTQFNQN